MHLYESLIKTFVIVCGIVALYVTVVAMMCGCSAPDPGYLGPIVHKDAGEDAAQCFPQEAGPKIACETACVQLDGAFKRSPPDSAVFDFPGCIDACQCVQPDGIY